MVLLYEVPATYKYSYPKEEALISMLEERPGTFGIYIYFNEVEEEETL